MIRYDSERPDPAAYFELFATTGWNDWYHANVEDLSRALDRSQYTVSAYSADRLVGFGRAVADGLHAMIYDLIVHPEHKGTGIGSEILGQLVERCREDGICDVQLFSARGTAGFYERNGFTRRPPDSPGMERRFPGGTE